MNNSFSDRLTPGQIQAVFDALKIDWRPIYNPDNDGWVNCYHDHFNSDLSINIHHGGWVNQYMAGHPDSEVDGIPTRGDIVTLVTYLNFRPNEEGRAIAWIKDSVGMNRGVQPPDVREGGKFAREWLQKENGTNYVQVPDEVWKSKISSSAKIVWMAILSRINKGEIYSFAGIRNICKQTNLASATVQRAISELEGVGLLLQKPSRIGQKVNKYPIVIPTDTINGNLEAYKQTVSEIDTGCIRNEYGTVSEIDTELEPMNYSHLIKTKSLQGQDGKTPFMPVGYFSFFFQTFKDSMCKSEYCIEDGITAQDLIAEAAA